MLGSTSTSREIAKDDNEILPLTIRKDVVYYLITDITGSIVKRINYPLKAIFAINPEKESFFKSIQGERKVYSPFIIHARTPNGIRNQILKTLSVTSKGKEEEKAFLIDCHLPLSINNRLLLYHLLLQNYKHVYLIDSKNEESDESLNFIEIFPDERAITLCEQMSNLRH
ncbi:MAG: hypothetical protein LBF34_01070 [Puniceicoccales bacterium]|jgi:hypothetical protein|nr:hypothetical protein [Puniceicoccales bacterium]